MKKRIILRKNIDIFLNRYDIVKKCLKINNRNYLFRVLIKLKLPISFFFGEWKKNLKNIEEIIIFDNAYNNQLAKYIKRKNKDIKIILWYWNSLIEYGNENIAKNDEYIDEIWTYNKFDAQKNNLKVNTQFYSKELSIEDNIQQDIVFMGREKGRKQELNALKEKFNELNLNSEFLIIEKESDLISYDEYLKMIAKSKCILDYGMLDYCGLSLRPLEALFFERKLITNNKDIVNYDFYNKDNIFILGIDEINNLPNFLNSPYKKIDKKIIEKYDFDSWISRFED